jgi:hypothetical protein
VRTDGAPQEDFRLWTLTSSEANKTVLHRPVSGEMIQDEGSEERNRLHRSYLVTLDYVATLAEEVHRHLGMGNHGQ